MSWFSRGTQHFSEDHRSTSADADGDPGGPAQYQMIVTLPTVGQSAEEEFPSMDVHHIIYNDYFGKVQDVIINDQPLSECEADVEYTLYQLQVMNLRDSSDADTPGETV